MARVPIAVVNTLQQIAHPLSVGKEQSPLLAIRSFRSFQRKVVMPRKERTYMQRKDRKD